MVPTQTPNSIKIRSGLLVDPFGDDYSALTWGDICHSQSLLCRFTGHCRVHYSVALHTIIVHDLVRLNGGTLNEQRWALLHDGSEVFFNDVAKPIKRRLGEYTREERECQAKLGKRFGLEGGIPEIVHAADWTALLIEAQDLFDNSVPEEYGEVEWPSMTLQSTLRRIFFHGSLVGGDVLAAIPMAIAARKLHSLWPLS
jgi:hypothetical protein